MSSSRQLIRPWCRAAAYRAAALAVMAWALASAAPAPPGRRHDITSAEERHQLCEQLHKRWLLIGRRMKGADETDRAA